MSITSSPFCDEPFPYPRSFFCRSKKTMSFDIRGRRTHIYNHLPLATVLRHIVLDYVGNEIAPAKMIATQAKVFGMDNNNIYYYKNGYLWINDTQTSVPEHDQIGIYYVKKDWIVIRGYNIYVVVNTVTYEPNSILCKALRVFRGTIYYVTKNELNIYEPETKRSYTIGLGVRDIKIQHNNLIIKRSDGKYYLRNGSDGNRIDRLAHGLFATHMYNDQYFYINKFELKTNDFLFAMPGKVTQTSQIGHCVYIVTNYHDYVWDLKHLEVYPVDYMHLEKIGKQRYIHKYPREIHVFQ